MNIQFQFFLIKPFFIFAHTGKKQKNLSLNLHNENLFPAFVLCRVKLIVSIK